LPIPERGSGFAGYRAGRRADRDRSDSGHTAQKETEYAEIIANRMRNPEPDFKQYARAVSIHERGRHDEGGR
jgi:hypothetical protein